MILSVLFFGALGAIVASFTGVVAARAHTGQSWFKGRSRCDSCARTLTTPDLVPVLSWLASRGRCRTCGVQVSFVHALSELTLAFLFVLSYVVLGLTVELFLVLGTLSVLLFIVLYDLRHTLIPPVASLLLFVFCVVYAFIASGNLTVFGGALVSAGVIGLIFFLTYLLSRGRAMGLGDAPLALSLSLLAYLNPVTGLIFSFWIGAVVGIGILVFERGGPKMGREVPFAPFLAAGYLLAYFTSWTLFSYPVLL